MKKKNFLCVDLDVYTHNTNLLTNEGRNGRLTMTEDNEHFVFEEQSSSQTHRNTRVWTGHRINITKDVFGHFRVNLRQLELSNKLDALKFAEEIKNELTTAKEELFA